MSPEKGLLSAWAPLNSHLVFSLPLDHRKLMFLTFIGFQPWIKGGYISMRQPFGNPCVFNQLSITSKNRGRPWEIILCFGSLSFLGRKLQRLLSNAPFQRAKLFMCIVPPRWNPESVPPPSSVHILTYFIRSDFASPAGSGAVRTVHFYNLTSTHFPMFVFPGVRLLAWGSSLGHSGTLISHFLGKTALSKKRSAFKLFFQIIILKRQPNIQTDILALFLTQISVASCHSRPSLQAVAWLC